MARLENGIVINRPVEDVWEFVATPENATLWASGLAESKQLTAGPMGKGTQFRNVRRFLGREIETTIEITEWEPPKRMSAKATSGPIPFTGTRTFGAADGGTRVTEVVDAQIGGFFKLAEPIVARMIKRQIEADYANLRDLLEARA